MDSTTVSDFLPVNPRVFLVLLGLTEGARHGYGLKQAVEARSGGQVSLDAGALYRSIAKLVDDGLIEETDAPAEADRSDSRRRYYGLTQMGRAVVSAEATRLASLVDYAQRTAIIG